MTPALSARAADTEWFRANPDRRFRVRLAVPGELGDATDLDGVKAVVLYRFAADAIACWLATVEGLPPDTDDDGLALLREAARQMVPREGVG